MGKLKPGGTLMFLAHTMPPWAGKYYYPSKETIKQHKAKNLSYHVHRCMPSGFGIPKSIGGGCASLENLNFLRDLVEAGKLRTRLDHTFEIRQISDAIDQYMTGRTVG